MTQPTRPRFTPASHANDVQQRIGCLFRLGLVVVVLFAVYYLFSLANGPPKDVAQAPAPNQERPQPSTESPAAHAPPAVASKPPTYIPVPQPPTDDAQSIETATAASIQRQQLAAGKVKQRQVIALYDELARALDAWEGELAAWQKAGPVLLKNEAGKRIAADETLTRQFRALLAQELPTRDQLAAARTAAADLVAPVREAEKDPNDASFPNDGIVKGLDDIRSQARKSRDELRQATEQVQAILAKAGGAAGQKPLQEVIAAQTREDAEARSAAITAAVMKADEKGTKRIAEEKANAALAQKEQQAESIRVEAERQAQAAKMATLRKKARSQEVRKYLAPFLAVGFSQPHHAGGNDVIFDKTGDEGPMSLTRIRNVGGLDKGGNGVQTLAWIGSSLYNDRSTKWNFNVALNGLSSDSIRFVKTAQDLLNELGEALVEEKMLAP